MAVRAPWATGAPGVRSRRAWASGLTSDRVGMGLAPPSWVKGVIAWIVPGGRDSGGHDGWERAGPLPLGGRVACQCAGMTAVTETGVHSLAR
jgi:hypothetical protein